MTENVDKEYLDELNLAFSSTIDVIKEAIDCRNLSSKDSLLCNNIINVNMFAMREIENKLKNLLSHNKYIVSRMKGSNETINSN